MGFVTAIRLGFSKWLDFKGRATRPEYWYFTLLFAICNLVSGICDKTFGTYPGGMDAGRNAHPYGLFSIAVLVVMTVPHCAVAVRRLHDTNHSGWWYGAVFILLIVGSLAMMALTGLGAIIMLVAGVVLLANLVFFCTPGTTDSPNRFGPPPMAPAISPVPE